MNEINWNQFMLKNSNPQEAFETICRNLFLREYKVSSHGFTSNYNQIGLETEPVHFKGKYYGFQCKYSESENGAALYKQVYDSLDKAVKLYPQLDVVIIYTNLDVKPNVSKQELEESKVTNRIKIHKLGMENDIEIRWFLKSNFEKALNDVKNYDLYRTFFSSQNLRGLLNDAITHDDRTFLASEQFIDLSLNGKKFSNIKEDILSQNISIIIGSAGTGKSEILKNLYFQCETQYLSNINTVFSDSDISIPIFLRMRECLNGDLEGLLRNRLKDFDVDFLNKRNHYIYFLDGIDEISTGDFGGVITYITRLESQETTKAFVLTSRNNTTNLTTVLRDLKPKVYTIEPLNSNAVEDYFSRYNNPEKQKKLQEIKENNPSFFEDITDIFSAVLFNKNIFQIDETTTKIDLIKFNAEKLVENNQKYSLINLPEPKLLSVEKILGQVSELMQRSGNISVSQEDLQRIIDKLFPNCSYLQVDEIIDFISEMFFEHSFYELSGRRYSYRHKRYFEFYLYSAVKNVFYDNPAILRELRLLSNQDFIINIFLLQELKNNILNNNLQRTLVLRFFEAYLGQAYLCNVKSPWLVSKELLLWDTDFYLQSPYLNDFLCTKREEDLRDFIKNDPLSISKFLTTKNYYSFVKQYHIANGIDIRKLLIETYFLSEEWLEQAAQKDQSSLWYCKCVIDGESINDVYINLCCLEAVTINDVEHYRYNLNKANVVAEFFEMAIEYFNEWLVSIVTVIPVRHLEALSYVLLRSHNLRHIQTHEGLSPISAAIVDRVNSFVEHYEIHTITLYKVLTGDTIQGEDIQQQAKTANTTHCETWQENFELNSYIGSLYRDFEPYCYDCKLGIALREKMSFSYLKRKTDVLPTILEEVKKFNLVCKNRFSHYNAIFIGEIIAYFNVGSSEVKKFIADLRRYSSVVSTFQVLYTIMKSNPKLFSIIANPSLITSEYEKVSKDLSHYDYTLELGFMYATMISCFDILKADSLFERALNNSVFRPISQKENLIDYHLSSCLLTAYNNYWFSNEELELLIRRQYVIMKIAKDTLYNGADYGYFKYLIEQSCPHLLNIFETLDIESIKIEREIEWESFGSNLPKENVSIDNISEYYNCNISGINYSSISVWEELIGIELMYDSELNILYKVLDEKIFPGAESTKISNCFHIIIAVLISNIKTRPKVIDFIIRHTGRMGLVYMIKSFALIGDDQSGRHYIEMLMKLCETIVYPLTWNMKKIEGLNNNTEKIVDIVCDSKTNDWEVESQECIMIYKLDPKISVRWDQPEMQEPYTEQWAKKHSNKKASSVRYYIYYREEKIKTFNMVWVDDYKALIPMPNITNKHIDRKSYSFSCLINHDIDTLNRYIMSSGLIVD